MTSAPVAPIIPSTAGHDRGPGSRPVGSGSRRHLPVPQLKEPMARSRVHGLATIDHRGRIADAGVVRALYWSGATRLDIREQAGLLLVTASPHGVFSPTREGYLRLPAAVRRWCGLGIGDRVLLVAVPDDGLPVVHPPAALDAMVGWLHASALDGGRP